MIQAGFKDGEKGAWKAREGINWGTPFGQSWILKQGDKKQWSQYSHQATNGLGQNPGVWSSLYSTDFRQWLKDNKPSP
jgi:hypothetical protein